MSSKNLGFKGGISLAFVSYPSAVLEMEVSPLWSFLFFFMLINLALSSICGGMQTFLAFIIDEKPSLKKYQTWILVGLCILFFCAGLPMVKLTTCFHEFSKIWIYEFFYQILCNICFENAQNWEKLPFLTNKEFVFFFNWELIGICRFVIWKFVKTFHELNNSVPMEEYYSLQCLTKKQLQVYYLFAFWKLFMWAGHMELTGFLLKRDFYWTIGSTI